MSLALARKWRPKTFSELVGQDHVVRALTNALEQGRVHHAWLFTGTRGVGKTTLARIIAKALNCNALNKADPCGVCDSCLSIDQGRFVDVIELDAASNTQVDNMRDLLETAAYKPTVGDYKIFIIDEVHMLSRSAFNAMLKTLEEPPEHVKFILATTDPQKVPITVLSRCLQFNLKPIPVPIIEEQMKKILGDEGIEFESRGIELLSRYARGSLRDGLSLLDQSIAQGNGRVEEESVKSMLGVVDESLVHELVEIALNQDADQLTQKISEIERMGASFSFVLDEMASLLQRLSLFSLTTQGLDERLIEGYRQLVDQTDDEHLQLLYQIATVGKRDLPLAPDDKIGFTMILLRMMAFLPACDGEAQPQKKKVVAKMVPTSKPSSQQKVKLEAGKKSQMSVDLKTNADWKAFVSEKVSSGMAKMLAENSEFESFGNGVLRLSLDGDQKHLLEDRYQGKLQELLREHIDAKCRLEIKMGAVSDTPLATEEVEIKKRLDQATRDLEEDPFVKSLKDDLGGTLVSDSIRPTK
jgi:DNA polymerase-3 subunit gamma/tau